MTSSTAAARIIRLELLVDKQAAALAASDAQLVKLQTRSRTLSRDVQPGLRQVRVLEARRNHTLRCSLVLLHTMLDWPLLVHSYGDASHKSWLLEIPSLSRFRI